MKKKRVFIFAVCLVVITLIILTMIFKIDNKDDSYAMHIQVSTVDLDDNRANVSLNYKSSKGVGVIESTHRSSPIYIKGKTLLYKENGRYKKLHSKDNFNGIYDLLSSLPRENEIDLKDDKKRYNPIVDSKKINKILDSLFLGKNVSNDTSVYFTLESGKIKEFSTSLNGLENYKTCNITITFSESTRKVVMPKIYKNLTDEAPKETLSILK